MELITQLAQNGLLALILAISLFTNARLFGLLIEEKDKRVEEAKTIRDSIIKPLDNLQTTLSSIILILQNIASSKK